MGRLINKLNIGTRDIIFGSVTGAASDVVRLAQSCWISFCMADKFEGQASANFFYTLYSKASMLASMVEI